MASKHYINPFYLECNFFLFQEATRMLGDLTCKKNRLAQDLKVAKCELQTKEVELSNLEKQLDLAK